MDSLLANYGSDEEHGDASPATSPDPAPVSKSSVAPAPTLKRSSIFGSLPPPKAAGKQSSSLWDDDEEVLPLQRLPKSPITGDSDEEGALDRSSKLAKEMNGDKEFGAISASVLPSSRPDSSALPSDFFSNSSASSVVDEDDLPSPDFSEKPQGKSGSLFSRLPPPSKSTAGSLVSPINSTGPAKKKKVVEFRPPINLDTLRTPDDDDLPRYKKPAKATTDLERETGATTGTGLFAMLPPPKHSLGAGVGLGSGAAHGGRRMTMETSSVTTSGIAGSAEHDHHHHRDESRTPKEALSRPVENPHFDEAVYQPAYHSGQFGNSQQLHADNQLYGSSSFTEATNATDWHHHRGGATGDGHQEHAASGKGSSTDVLAEILKKDRKRGREGAPAVMMEVKQADLTGEAKLRQDQIRSTGIAFGPAYQPASSSKDKPSKLHRRKHQLGALYYDMKQNEMNLMERRAKGQLTKAETQAKYGW